MPELSEARPGARPGPAHWAWQHSPVSPARAATAADRAVREADRDHKLGPLVNGVARPVTRRRLIARYLAVAGLGVPIRRAAEVFGVRAETITDGCAVVEDQRDDPAADHLLDALNERARTILETMGDA